MKKGFLRTVFVLVCLLLLGAAGAYLLLVAPQEAAFSERENRMLAEKPALTADTLWSGAYGAALETYFLDRFPLRDRVIAFAQACSDAVSLADYEDLDAVLEAPEDPALAAAAQAYEEYVPERTPTPRPTPSPTPTPPALTPTPSPTPNALKEAAQAVDTAVSTTLRVSGMLDGKEYGALVRFSPYDVKKGAALFDRFAAVLPEDGHVIVCFIPSTYRMRGFISAEGAEKSVVSPIEPLINAVTGERVIAVPASETLGEAIGRGEYVYFRSDMHYTPWGTQLVMERALEQVGRKALPYDAYSIEQEAPFLGTIYRDKPSQALRNHADTLDKLTPPHAVTVMRLLSAEEQTELPLLDENTHASDRYCVYLGGPGGPWTVLTGAPEAEDACLVVADSFGMVPAVLLTGAYRTVHYTDPRYFSAAKLKNNIAGLIRENGIRDVYLVFSEGHAFGTDFFELLTRQLGE